MEFEHVGRHCALPECKQRDFLPFQCDFCHESFCLEHRTYAAHGCGGAASNDMTSIDCPICNKPVKFSKSQNADEVWNQHYLNSCTQQAAPAKVVQKCCRPGCRQHLGPSNTFTCPKCRKTTCLTHRIAEEHMCSSLTPGATKPDNSANPRANFLDRIESQTKRPAPKPKPSAFAKQPAPAADNTLKGSAHRRMKDSNPAPAAAAQGSAPTQASPAAADFQCPFCGLSKSNVVELECHVNDAHADILGTSPAPRAAPPSASQSSQSNNSLAREVCPTCGQRFFDPIALVEHCERSHPSNQRSTPAQQSRECALS